MGKMHRAQILLEPEQHSALADIAQREGTSISEIVRSAVQDWLSERQEDEVVRQRLDDVAIIQRRRQTLLERSGGKLPEVDIDTLIDQMRADHGAELLENVFGRTK